MSSSSPVLSESLGTIPTVGVQTPQLPRKNRGGRPKRDKEIPIETLIQYRKQGLTHEEIARIVGCNRRNVTSRLAVEGLEIDGERVEAVRRATAAVLTLKRHQVVENMTAEKLAKAPVRDLALVFDKLHQAERLELNLSTQNVATYAHLLRQGSTEDEELKAIEAEVVSRETL